MICSARYSFGPLAAFRLTWWISLDESGSLIFEGILIPSRWGPGLILVRVLLFFLSSSYMLLLLPFVLPSYAPPSGKVMD